MSGGSFMETTLPKITSPVPSETRLFRAVVSHCASASQAEEVVASFAELSWEQLGGKLDSELPATFLTTKAVMRE